MDIAANTKRFNRLLKSQGLFKTLAYGAPLFLLENRLLSLRGQAIKKISKKAKNGLIMQEVNGSKMLLDLSDEGLSQDLLIDGVREVFSTEQMKKDLKEGDIVVEIGANIGYYALLEI